MKGWIEDAWKGHGEVPVVALCKEGRTVRELTGIQHEQCNCG